MADADEDVMPTLSSQNTTDDLEDETQDFRFLSQLTATSLGTAPTGQTQSTLPKRGIKDFEPNSTRTQATALDDSREAMHVALSAVRVHSGKNHIVGQYLPDERDWRLGGRCVVVYKFKSTHAKAMGQADSRNWVWFLPEEALYLLERGSLDIRWPAVKKDSEEEEKRPDGSHTESEEEATKSPPQLPVQPVHDSPEPGELPMSLQGAYASFIGKSGLTLERYIVYAGLKRSGYIVQRAPTWDDQDVHTNGHTHPETEAHTQNSTLTTSYGLSTPTSSHPATTILHRLFSWLFTPARGNACPALGPFVAPGLYRNYNDIFRALTLIPYHHPDSPTTSTQPPAPQNPFTVTFQVHKPTTAYKKSSPPPPDYHIAVLDARTSHVPSMTEIGALLDTTPEDSLPKDKTPRLETRIKHGRRNVLLAIVDAGVVSYLRFSEAAFGADKLWEDREKAKAKWKGKKGGGGGGGKSSGKGKGKGSKGGQQQQGQKANS